MEVSVGKHGLPFLTAPTGTIVSVWMELSGAEEYMEAGRYGRLHRKRHDAFLAITAASSARSPDSADEKPLAGFRKIDSMERRSAPCRKGNAYARLLFNQYPGFTHAGAEGDGLDTDGSGGTFFLNSFSWSILSGVANDAEIASMLEVVRTKLKTPYGLKLVSPNDLSRVVPDAASAEYFPGDRENAAVFKHASMMAVSAMLDAAKRVADSTLAKGSRVS